MTQRNIQRSWGVALLLVFVSPCGAIGQETELTYGMRVYPDAEPLPEVSRAVEAFYRPGMPPGADIEAAVFQTPASFEEVYRFYGVRMDPGKWGWRRKSYILRHQTQTLRFMRAGFTADDAVTLEQLEPLFGDVELTAAEFAERLGRLNAEHPEAQIEVAEGTREVAGDPAGAQIRITIEHPYIEPRRMELVDRTRIVLVKVAPRGEARDE